MSPRRSLTVALTLTLSALLLSACGDKGDKGLNDTERDWSGLTKALDSYVGIGDEELLGYSFALNVNGKQVYSGASGVLSVDSVIPIASASKAPSATIVLSLANDGLIDLDAPVSDYIGDIVDWPWLKRDITTRMLLNHTSGLPFDSACLNDDDTTLADCVQEIADSGLSFLPGARFGYSGTGYQVAGLVAERASGKSWHALVDEKLVQPLGMNSFSYGDTDNPRIAGGASCDTSDYLKFLQLYLNGGQFSGTRIISTAQAEQATQNQVAGLPVYYTPIPDGSGLEGYSFGFWISDEENHPGSNGPEISDPGLFGTTPWLDVDKSYAAVILITNTTETGLAMWDSARSKIIEQLEP